MYRTWGILSNFYHKKKQKYIIYAIILYGLPVVLLKSIALFIEAEKLLFQRTKTYINIKLYFML